MARVLNLWRQDLGEVPREPPAPAHDNLLTELSPSRGCVVLA